MRLRNSNQAAVLMTAVCLCSAASSSTVVGEDTNTGAIAWYGTWDGGLAAAKRTGRPILLISAAPQCHGTPGIW